MFAELAGWVRRFINLANQIDALKLEVKKMTAELQKLTDAVTALKSVDESAIALLKQLADQVKANANDPAAILKLADEINAEAANLAAAVTANTPAQPQPPAPTP